MRDYRINKIFEGSSEIMHLLIAREAVDAHLAAAGALAVKDATLRTKATAAAKASGFYATWLPQLVTGKGNLPTAYAEFGPLARHLRFVERASRKLARQTFYGMSRWQAGLEYRQSFLGRVVDIGAEHHYSVLKQPIEHVETWIDRTLKTHWTDDFAHAATSFV